MKNKVITSSLLLLLTFALASCQNGGGDRTKKDSYKVLTYLTSADSEAYQTVLDSADKNEDGTGDKGSYLIIKWNEMQKYSKTFGS